MYFKVEIIPLWVRISGKIKVVKLRILLVKLKAIRENSEISRCFGAFLQKAFGKKSKILLNKLKATGEYCQINQCFGSLLHKAVGKSLSSSFTREISRKKFHSYARLKTKGHWHQLRAIVKISEKHLNYWILKLRSAMTNLKTKTLTYL